MDDNILKFNIKGIGNVDEADISIDGLTILVGKNKTGKSTINKTIYSLLNIFYNKEVRQMDSIKSIFKSIGFRLNILKNNALRINKNTELNSILSFETDLLAMINSDNLLDLIQQYINDINVHSDKCIDIINKLSSDIDSGFSEIIKSYNNFLEEEIIKVKNVIDVNNFIKERFINCFLNEFNNQFFPIKSDSNDICLKVSYNGISNSFKIEKKDFNVSGIDFNNKTYVENIDVYFIDDENVCNQSLKFGYDGYLHKNKIINRIDHINDYNYIQNDLNIEIKKLINLILPENISINKDGVKVYGDDLYVENLSSGSKFFSTLKQILACVKIDKNTLFILDEPECHLHPEWQQILSEIICLLIKNTKCKILLSSHNQYFIRCLIAYSKKYNIFDNTNIYLNKGQSVNNDVQRNFELVEDVKIVYNNLLEPELNIYNIEEGLDL